MSGCYCTGACKATGICPNHQPAWVSSQPAYSADQLRAVLAAQAKAMQSDEQKKKTECGQCAYVRKFHDDPDRYCSSSCAVRGQQ